MSEAAKEGDIPKKAQEEERGSSEKGKHQHRRHSDKAALASTSSSILVYSIHYPHSFRSHLKTSIPDALS